MASRTSGQVRSSIQTERVSPYAGSTAKANAAIRKHTVLIDICPRVFGATQRHDRRSSDCHGAVKSLPRMNMHASRHFVPPRPAIPEHSLGWYRLLVALRTNALQIWPREAYTKDVLEQDFFGRKRFLLNGPDAIHHVLVDNIANYRRTTATIRILRPIVGEGLILSEGEEWRHQRRTIAPTLAPRVIPMLARHIAGTAEE